MRIFFIIMLLWVSFGAGHKSPQSKIECIRITQILPIPDLRFPGKMRSLDTTIVDFYFSDDIRIYRMPYVFETFLNGIVKSAEKRVRYFLHDKDSLYGREFDSGMHYYNKRAHIDTVTSIRSFTDLQLKLVFNAMNMKLISQKTNQDSGTLHEKYFFENKIDSTERGLLFLSYTHALDDISFHLSPYMDSIKKKKVNYYHMISFGGPVKNSKIIMDTLFGTVQMQRIDPPDRQRVLEYMQAYLKASSSLGANLTSSNNKTK
jgi:hypothetical protein